MDEQIKVIIISGIVGLFPALLTFFIARFGYAKKYRKEIEDLDHEIRMKRITLDRSAYETYDSLIASFRNHIENINTQNEKLIEQVQNARELINKYKDRIKCVCICTYK